MFSFKKFVPKSLGARFVLIIILPAILIQIATVFFFYNRHWQDVRYYMQESLVNDINLLFKFLDDKRYSKNEVFSIAKNDLNFIIRNKPRTIFYDDEKFTSIKQDLKYYNKMSMWQLSEKEDIYLYLHDKNLLIEIPRKRLYTPTTTIFIALMVSISFILVTVSLLFTKNQIRSIVRLAEAAEAFGRGQGISYFKPEGALEVKKAGFAFLDMKEKIEQQINQQSIMLAGVSHDLKTPLTRMKLALAMMEENELTKEIQDDIDEMHNMINEYLEFTKKQEPESVAEVDIIALMKTLVDKYSLQGKKINFTTNINSFYTKTKPISLRRAISNIIDNAMNFGTQTEVILKNDNDKLDIFIEDNGPGILESEQEKIFSAFYRSDYSRNLKKSGAGLGLAISRDIINSLGGVIKVNKINLKLKGASFHIRFFV